MTQAPTLEQFGHGAMVQNGHPAIGGRPCMLVLAEYEDFAPFSDFHTLEYYQKLGFGAPKPLFSTSGPVNPASLREYFRENSHGRFWFDAIAVVGPIGMGGYDPDLGGKPETRVAAILDRVFDPLFNGLDINLDNVVSSEELCVVIFENIPGLQPANRDNNPVTIRLPSPLPFPWPFSDKTIAIHVAGAGPLTPFFQIAHELSHSLGTRDLYGTGNDMLTLMGSYPFFSNDQVTVHLDSWHKLRLGWIEPRRFDLAVAGSEIVHTASDGTLLLWDAQKLADEYFLIERRDPGTPATIYDSGVAGNGVLIWRSGMSTVHLGTPSLVLGGSGVWRAGDQTPLLKWSDGSHTGSSILVSDAGSGALRVDWVPWGAELTLSEPSVADAGGAAVSEKTDQCGNVLQFGNWKTTTTITYTASAVLGFINPTIGWTLEGKALAAGGNSVSIARWGQTYHVAYQIAADMLSLTLTSAPGDTFEFTVGFQASDAAGRAANIEYPFSVTEGGYDGMRWEDIGPAARCIAATIPVVVDVHGFTMPWEEPSNVDFRPVPMEWPGWKVEAWRRGALERLESDRSLNTASREALRSYIDLQTEMPRFRVAARELSFLRREG